MDEITQQGRRVCKHCIYGWVMYHWVGSGREGKGRVGQFNISVMVGQGRVG